MCNIVHIERNAATKHLENSFKSKETAIGEEKKSAFLFSGKTTHQQTKKSQQKHNNNRASFQGHPNRQQQHHRRRSALFRIIKRGDTEALPTERG